MTENDFLRTLKVIRSLAPNGSRICFDYLIEKRESGNPAEPFQFWIKSNELSKCLSNHNVKILDHINAQEMEKRYLTLKDGNLAEKSSELYCFVSGEFS